MEQEGGGGGGGGQKEGTEGGEISWHFSHCGLLMLCCESVCVCRVLVLVKTVCMCVLGVVWCLP